MAKGQIRDIKGTDRRLTVPASAHGAQGIQRKRDARDGFILTTRNEKPFMSIIQGRDLWIKKVFSHSRRDGKKRPFRPFRPSPHKHSGISGKKRKAIFYSCAHTTLSTFTPKTPEH